MTKRTIRPLASRAKQDQMKPVDLQLGWPSTRLFPKAQLQEAATQLLLGPSQLSDEALIYGPDPGSTCLREEIAKWLTRYYSPTAGPTLTENIFIANGASQALGIILDRYTDPLVTERIWMIEPTYFLACPIFEDAGFQGRLLGVPEDDQGIDIGFLRAKLETCDLESDRHSQRARSELKYQPRYPKIYRHVIYMVPTFSNPSGKVTSLERRKELVQLARKHDALIITDDVYDMVRWPLPPGGDEKQPPIDSGNLPPPPPRLVDVDSELEGRNQYGNACSNGSFSKIVAPGVRVSWVEGTAAFPHGLALHGATKSGGSPSQMSSLIIYYMLKSGSLMTHLAKEVLPTYQTRYSTMISSIRQHLEPLGVQITGGLPVRWPSNSQNKGHDRGDHSTPQAGGFFCYVMFPNDLPPADEIARIAAESYALRITPGQKMVVTGDPDSLLRCGKTFGRGARLSWSWHEADDLETGIKRLAMIINDIREGTIKAEMKELPQFGFKFSLP